MPHDSHVPAIGNAIARDAQREPYWEPFFQGFEAVHSWLARVRPDTVVMFYNDHGLNFFLDSMPTFAIGAAPSIATPMKVGVCPWRTHSRRIRTCHGISSRNLSVQASDMTTCQKMLVDHAFVVPMELLWPGAARRVRTVPIAINTVQHPLPSASRCYARSAKRLEGRSTHFRATRALLVVGTGGLSHQLDGQRAGFINKEFDLMCMDKLVDDPEALTGYTNRELVERAGAQGIEILMWIAPAVRCRGPQAKCTATTTFRSRTRLRDCCCWKVRQPRVALRSWQKPPSVRQRRRARIARRRRPMINARRRPKQLGEERL